jgi:hypothetical protein
MPIRQNRSRWQMGEALSKKVLTSPIPSWNGTDLLAFPSPMTGSMRAAVSWLRQFAVGANACLRVHTPEIAVIGRRHRWIGIDIQVDALPTQRRTQIRMVGIETIPLVDNHALPPFAA